MQSFLSTGTYPVKSQCNLLGVSPQAYYQHGDSSLRKFAVESFVVEFVRRVCSRDPGIGSIKLWHMYRKEFGDVHATTATMTSSTGTT